MTIRDKIPALPTVLAVVAIVIAGSGTAVAVSATTTISDPKTPSRIAHVDAAGRLTTIGATSDIDGVYTGLPSQPGGVGDVFITSPTAATIGVTRFAVAASPGNTGTYYVTLYQVPLDPDGTCSEVLAWRLLSTDRVAPGGRFEQNYSAPLTVQPRTGASYCLDAFASAYGGATNANDSIQIQLTAATVAGRYTGSGSGSAKAGTKDANGKTVVGS